MSNLEKLKQDARARFIKEYCVKRPAQEIRWIRAVFYDDKDQIETILCEIERAVTTTYQQAVEEVLGKVSDYVKAEMPSDFNAVMLINHITKLTKHHE